MTFKDLILNSYFTNYNGLEVFGEEKETKHCDFNVLSMFYYEERDIDGLVDALIFYSGPNYKDAAMLLAHLEKFEEAMDMALKNKDYELCKSIYEIESYYINNAIECSLYNLINR